MSKSVLIAVAMTGWAAALFGTLKLNQLPGDWGHDICGPWGCGPPLQALVSCHAFWAVFVAGPIVLAWRKSEPATLRRAGVVLLAAGVVGLAAIAIWQAVTWLPHTSGWRQSYFIQRYFFVLATLVEIPVVPVTLAGVVLWAAGRAARRRLTGAVEDVEGTGGSAGRWT